MINKRRIALFFLVLLVILSCKKKPIVEINKDFEGSWRHYYGKNSYADFYIGANSRGDIESYEEGMTARSMKFKWLIKKDKLYHGWLATKDHYKIDKYPTVAETLIIDNYDTIPIGRIYMILDGDYYIK